MATAIPGRGARTDAERARLVGGRRDNRPFPRVAATPDDQWLRVDLGDGEVDTSRSPPPEARYVRMTGVRLATSYGYSL